MTRTISRTIRVRGKVQGVFFRQSTRQEALRLGLHGFVRNEPDRSVYIEVVGPGAAVEALIEWCHHGPQLARVATVEVAEGPEEAAFSSFEVRA